MSTDVMSAPSTRQRLGSLVRYGRHGWASFGCGLLRSTGFPADGLDALCCRPLLGQADAALARGGVDHQFVREFEEAGRRVSEQLSGVVQDPRLAVAMTWQNPTAWRMASALAHPGKDSSDRRRKERQLALYWQRYCAKAETIGFFGPFAWMPVEANATPLRCEPGKDLARETHVAFEAWMVIELGKWLAGREEVRWWLPAVLSPAIALDEETAQLVVPGLGRVQLRTEELRVLRLADGTRSAHDICQQSGVEEARGRRILASFARRRLLQWDANIPVSVRAWQVLRQRVAGIGDAELRGDTEARLAPFEDALAQVARAVDAESLRTALAGLDELFESVTGASASRGAGQAYAARTLAYSDATRDVDAVLGTGFLDRIDEPLSLLLRSADWFADRLARGYEQAITELVEARGAGATVRVSDVWSSTMSLFWGDEPTPLREAVADLSLRWTSVLDDVTVPAGESRVQVASAHLARAVENAFPACVPLPELSVHSPDLQVVADTVDDINEGRFEVVLGELHACLPSLEMPLLEWALGGGQVRDAINEALGLERLVPLFPDSWRRNTGRMVPASLGVGDRAIGFTRTACPDRAGLWSMAELVFVHGPDGLRVASPDGKQMRIAQVWAVPISMVAADAFKVGLSGEHTPRLTIDNLVVFREAWKISTAPLQLGTKSDRYREFLEVRRWQTQTGLPDQVFVKFAHETKPVLVDFASPPMVAAFVSMVRAARDKNLPDSVSASEVLPDPRQSWLRDANDDRYVHEFRLQITKDQR